MENATASPLALTAFTTHPAVEAFRLPPPTFLTSHFASARSSTSQSPAPTLLATGAIVFDRPILSTDKVPGDAKPTAVDDLPQQQPPRVLLVQRAAHDSMPLRWEIPGGGCDDDDPSVLHSCARELREEASLSAAVVGPLVPCPGNENPEQGEHEGGQFFFTRRGKLVCKFYFVVEVPEEQTASVAIDPNEHAGYLWATEEEVRNKRTEGSGGVELTFTTKEQWEVLLEAFTLWR